MVMFPCRVPVHLDGLFRKDMGRGKRVIAILWKTSVTDLCISVKVELTARAIHDQLTPRQHGQLRDENLHLQ